MAVLRSIHEGFGILYFDTKTHIFEVHPQVTAAAATEEFSSTASPHPIMHRDTTLTPIIREPSLLSAKLGSIGTMVKRSPAKVRSLICTELVQLACPRVQALLPNVRLVPGSE